MLYPHTHRLSRRRFLAAATLPLLAPEMALAQEPPRLCSVQTRFEGLPPNTVVLTLDACDGATDMVLADYLSHERIACSVFATGMFARKTPKAVEDFLARGWDVLNHGAEHHAPIASPGRLWNVPCVGSMEGLRHEVEEGARVLSKFRAQLPRVYRGATAMYDERTLAWLAANGWTIGGFTVAGDSGGRSSKAYAQKMLEKVRPGDVLLAHINHPERNNGVHVLELLAGLRARGMSFVSWEQAQQLGVRKETLIGSSIKLTHTT